MNNKIEWFNNGKDEPNTEYIGVKNNVLVCRIKREKAFSDFWVARDKNSNYLFRDMYREEVFIWVEIAF